MLQVKDIHIVSRISLEIDEYIPLSLKCSDSPIDLPLYWRTGNFTKSLITVGLNPTTGAIYSVTVTQIERLEELREDFDGDLQHSLSGVPACEIGGWPSDRYKDEPGLFAVSIREQSVFVEFGCPVKPLVQYQAGNVTFYVDANSNLFALRFSGIKEVDMERIVSSVGY